DWGGRYDLFARAFPGKDLYITEYGDSTPNRSATEKARIYSQWIKSVRAQGTGPSAEGVVQGSAPSPLSPIPRPPVAACAFILSSADDAWASFSLDEEACEILGRVEG
ncbi:MAG: hypothetical protein Q7R39_01475, partial [Dehalococcoidia bacterium]|nr:hypothetical protein [Dehalococcoidia bacterium]